MYVSRGLVVHSLPQGPHTGGYQSYPIPGIEEPKRKKSRIKHGVREWATKSVNFLDGCQHGCLYCYACCFKAGRMGKKLGLRPKDWTTPRVNPEMLKRSLRQAKRKERVVMYPSTHDIHPDNLGLHLQVIRVQVNNCDRLLIVSKPHLECIRAICDAFPEYKDKILFRFSIGSADSTVLGEWEPNAPTFEERLECLKHAHKRGFQTSVSCEPMLDDHIEDVVEACRPYVTDAIWLGKINRLKSCLALNGHNSPTTLAAANKLTASQSDTRINELYGKYRDDAKIKFKESIKRVVGIALSTVDGLDR